LLWLASFEISNRQTQQANSLLEAKVPTGCSVISVLIFQLQLQLYQGCTNGS